MSEIFKTLFLLAVVAVFFVMTYPDPKKITDVMVIVSKQCEKSKGRFAITAYTSWLIGASATCTFPEGEYIKDTP